MHAGLLVRLTSGKAYDRRKQSSHCRDYVCYTSTQREEGTRSHCKNYVFTAAAKLADLAKQISKSISELRLTMLNALPF